MEIVRHDPDGTINIETRIDRQNAVETRIVRRRRDYVTVYLSTQTGCAMACRMCWLTQTGQNVPVDVPVDDVVAAAARALEYANDFETVHWAFMARGEPLESAVVLADGERMLVKLDELARARGARSRFLLSTIYPESMRGRALADTFRLVQPEVYWSLYGTDDAVRRRWTPRAMPADDAAAALAEWQRVSRKLVKVHHAVIEGVNDSAEHAAAVGELVRRHGLRVDVNLVRYNPYRPGLGEDPGDAVLEALAQAYRTELPESRVDVVSRVGREVYASCGMFPSDG